MKQRLNLRELPGMILVPLGKDRYIEGGVVHFVERLGFGVHVVAAVTRFGKSILVKNLYTNIGQYRKVIILDYLGEHSMSRYPNFLSEDQTMCLPRLKEVKDFKFKISQFNNAGDWRSLGVPDKSSMVMEDLCKQKKAHRDDPDLFKQMIDDLPVDWSMVEGFERKWGFEMSKLNHTVIESITTKFLQLYRQEFFAEVDDPTYDFGTLALQHHSLNINFQLNQVEAGKARAIAGKVLEQIEDVLDKMGVPPLIVVEEGDILAPNIMTEGVIISSLDRLIKWVIKLQKKGVELLFIVQDLNNLHPTIVGNAHTLLLGQLPSNNPYHEITRQLRWDYDDNYREFLIIRKGKSGYQVFSPHDSCTMY